MIDKAAARRQRWATMTPRQRAAAQELARRRRQRRRGVADTRDEIGWLQGNVRAAFPLEAGPHHRWIATRLDPRGATGVRAFAGAPRGSGKSATATLGLPLIAATRRSHRFIVVLRATEGDAVKAVEAIKAALDARPELTTRYPWLKVRRFGDGELRLGSCIILARGAGQAIRGLTRELGAEVIRPDLVVGDDLETEETARSKLLTDRLQEWLLGTVGQLGGPPGDEDTQPLDVVVIGTTLRPAALASRILDRKDPFGAWDVARFPAEGKVEAGPDGALEVRTAGKATAIPLPADAAVGDRVILWPAGMPAAYLDQLRDRRSPLFIGSRLYAQEYLLNPQAVESAIFKAQLTVWVPTLPAPSQLERLAIGVDSAVSKREAADYSAVVATGLYWPDDHRAARRPGTRADSPACLAVPYAARRRVSLNELLLWIQEVWQLLDGRAVVVFESNGAFAWGAQELRRRFKIPVRPVTADADKLTRATPLSVWHEAGRLHPLEQLRGSDFDEEVHAFTGTKADASDDQVDALVWAANYSTSAWRRR